MSYNLHITSVAQRDISQAADYIEFVLKNPKAADDLLEETDQKINALLPFPAEHPVVEDRLLSSWGIRFIQIKNYLAFYVAEENQVTIIRFLYAKSNWISILKSGIPLTKSSPPHTMGCFSCSISKSTQLSYLLSPSGSPSRRARRWSLPPPRTGC